MSGRYWNSVSASLLERILLVTMFLPVRVALGVDTEFPYRVRIVDRGVDCRDPLCRHHFRFCSHLGVVPYEILKTGENQEKPRNPHRLVRKRLAIVKMMTSLRSRKNSKILKSDMTTQVTSRVSPKTTLKRPQKSKYFDPKVTFSGAEPRKFS